MRYFAYLSFFVLGLTPLAANAADVTRENAKSIEAQIASLLPPSFRAALKILPAGNRYDTRIDIKAVTDAAETLLNISEMTPIAGTIAPRSDGLWILAAHGGLHMKGEVMDETRGYHLEFDAGDYQADALYDPVRLYPLHANLHFKDWKYSNGSPTQRKEESAHDYVLKLTTTDPKAGKVDAMLNAVTENFRIRVTGQEFHGQPLEISGASVIDTDNVTGIDLETVQQVFKMFVVNGAPSLGALNPEQRQELSNLLKPGSSLFSGLIENSFISKPKITFGGHEVSADLIRIAVRLSADRPGVATATMAMEKPLLKPGTFPHPVELAMPDEAGFGMRLSDVKIQDALRAFFTRPTFTDAPDSEDWVSNILWRPGTMRLDLVGTYMHSQYYSANVSGWISVNLALPNPCPEMDVTVTAHGLDRTVSFLQANANTVPWFGDASFFLLMAKGMGEPQGDGLMIWNIKADKAGKLTINGHEMAH